MPSRASLLLGLEPVGAEVDATRSPKRRESIGSTSGLTWKPTISPLPATRSPLSAHCSPISRAH
jgi:hypothetical protein